MVQIVEVDPSDVPAFARWHRALTEGALAGRTAATVSTLPELTGSLGDPSPFLRRIAVGAFAPDGSCQGAMLVELPLQEDLETIGVEIDVPPPHRGHGIGDALWRWAVQRAAEAGRTVVQVEVPVPTGQTLASWPGARFATARGFVSEHVEDHLVADLPFDARLLDELAGAAPSDGYRVTAWTGPCPEGLVQTWADLRTAMSVDVPTGGLTREAVVVNPERVRTEDLRMAASWQTLRAMAVDAAGTPVAYSVLHLPRTNPEHALQDDTLVLRAHRGHGLGTRLKVANLRQLAALADPGRRWLHTYTAQDNAAMQRVNARFGFRAVEEVHELELRS